MSKKSSTTRIIVCTIISVLLLTACAVGSIKVFSYSFNYTATIIEKDAAREKNPHVTEISVQITPETTIDDLATTLYANDFIANKYYFAFESKLGKFDNKLKTGHYSITSNMSSTEILKLVTSDPAIKEETITFIIPEGFTIVQIAERLDNLKIVSKEDFLKAVDIKNRAYDYDFLKDLSPDTKYALEGYLFPATYTVRKGVTPEEIIIMMLNKFQQVISNYTTPIKTSPYSLNEILTIASIIEQEAKVGEERPIISGVIYNRLASDMKLQMCSTIQYILDKRKAALSYSDLEVPSPYNTYIHEGLPLGAICSPGEAAISAAIMPDENPYFYFVLTGDDAGSHAFGETPQDHERNKIKYKQTVDKNFYE